MNSDTSSCQKRHFDTQKCGTSVKEYKSVPTAHAVPARSRKVPQNRAKYMAFGKGKAGESLKECVGSVWQVANARMVDKSRTSMPHQVSKVGWQCHRGMSVGEVEIPLWDDKEHMSLGTRLAAECLIRIQ